MPKEAMQWEAKQKEEKLSESTASHPVAVADSVSTRQKKVLVRRFLVDHSQRIRRALQIAFLALNGWIAGMWPVTRAYLRFIRPSMGSHPSTPAGRAL